MLIRLFPSFFHGISLARFWNILQVSLEKIRWTTLWNAFEFGQNDFFLTAFDCFSGEYEHFQHTANVQRQEKTTISIEGNSRDSQEWDGGAPQPSTLTHQVELTDIHAPRGAETAGITFRANLGKFW